MPVGGEKNYWLSSIAFAGQKGSPMNIGSVAVAVHRKGAPFIDHIRSFFMPGPGTFNKDLLNKSPPILLLSHPVTAFCPPSSRVVAPSIALVFLVVKVKYCIQSVSSSYGFLKGPILEVGASKIA